MPVQYTSILEEHKAVRSAAGIFDVSHMGEFFVSGADAAIFLDRLVTNRVSKVKTGKAVYSPMCTEDGTVVDDLIIYRLDENEFLGCVNAGNIEKDYDWFQQQADSWSYEVVIQNDSASYALLALQGPAAEEMLTAAGLKGVRGMKRFSHRLETFGDSSIRVCCTGYTGEDGFEIYISPQQAESLAEAILSEGESKGVQLCGLGARDSLRLEAGLPLYGHEISDEISPIEAGLEWTVKFDKGEFNGRDALSRQKETGLSQRVVHFKLEGRRIAREGTAVLDNSGQEVGRVLSGTLSPMTGSPFGSALVTAESLNDGLNVDLRGHQLQLLVATPPLHH